MGFKNKFRVCAYWTQTPTHKIKLLCVQQNFLALKNKMQMRYQKNPQNGFYYSGDNNYVGEVEGTGKAILLKAMSHWWSLLMPSFCLGSCN